MYWLVAPLLLKKQQLGWRRAAVAADAIERKFGAPPGGGHLEFIIFQNNSFFARRRPRRVCTGRLWFRDQKDLCVTRGALEISQTSNWDLNVVGDFSNSSLNRYLAGPEEKMGTVGISSLQLLQKIRFSLRVPCLLGKNTSDKTTFAPFFWQCSLLNYLVVPTSFIIVPLALPRNRSIYLLYYVDLIIFTGCLPSTENRVHAIQDLCRQGQFSRSVCSTYMFGANTYLLLRTTTFSPFSNQVSATEMTNFYRFSMSNQTAGARKGTGD